MSYLSLYTDAELQGLASEWKKALLAVSLGKSYSVDGQTVERSDVAHIKSTLSDIAEELQRRSRKGDPRIRLARIGRMF